MDERKKGRRQGGRRWRVGLSMLVTDLQAMQASKEVSLPDMAEILLLQRQQSPLALTHMTMQTGRRERE